MTLDASTRANITRKAGLMGVQSFATRALMGEAAARDIADALRGALAHQQDVRMVFAAAPSQAQMLAALCAAEGVDWTRVTAFHMDEYIGLAPDAPERFASWLDNNLFGRVPFAQVHHIVPEPDASAAAMRYADLLAAAPIDFVCLGIGVNGHIAFNDPPVADFADPLDVKVVTLDEQCRQQQVDDECFASFDDVPEQAITLTVPRLMRAGRLFCVVPGQLKRDAVRASLYGPISTECPASILRQHPDCSLYLDSESDPDAQ
ncbi:glucosamine-6-phosphate deaminase [Devosia lacusdianchii]|uniref:glucosamine-6-phosphate deaminase n=1 Tax=Devosia lacusdianchii TaxID=2917991 RepID=UPI0030B826E3